MQMGIAAITRIARKIQMHMGGMFVSRAQQEASLALRRPQREVFSLVRWPCWNVRTLLEPPQDVVGVRRNRHSHNSGALMATTVHRQAFLTGVHVQQLHAPHDFRSRGLPIVHSTRVRVPER